MIELTKEEVMQLLRAMSIVEGFLFQVKESNAVMEKLDSSIQLLTDKLITL